MEIILKASAYALISVILSMVIGIHNKEMSLILTVAVCCFIAVTTLTFLRPSIDFFQRLSRIGNINQDTLSILIKSTGIAILSEITALICTDASNATIGKALQLLAAVVILWLSLPLLNQLIDLLDNILGSV